MNRVAPNEARPVSLEEIIKSVADYYEMETERLCWPSKVCTIADARAVICFLSNASLQDNRERGWRQIEVYVIGSEQSGSTRGEDIRRR